MTKVKLTCRRTGTGERLGRSISTRTEWPQQLPTMDSLPQKTCPTLTPTKLIQTPSTSAS